MIQGWVSFRGKAVDDDVIMVDDDDVIMDDVGMEKKMNFCTFSRAVTRTREPSACLKNPPSRVVTTWRNSI